MARVRNTVWGCLLKKMIPSVQLLVADRIEAQTSTWIGLMLLLGGVDSRSKIDMKRKEGRGRAKKIYKLLIALATQSALVR